MKLRVEMDVASASHFTIPPRDEDADGPIEAVAIQGMTLDGHVGDYGIMLHLTAEEFRRAVQLQGLHEKIKDIPALFRALAVKRSKQKTAPLPRCPRSATAIHVRRRISQRTDRRRLGRKM